jgi:hypothetical protein
MKGIFRMYRVADLPKIEEGKPAPAAKAAKAAKKKGAAK